jgi:DNA/RNA endonuclease YhcR with UshA esterase domain
MNTRSMWVLAASFVAVAAAVPVSAHHSFAAEYDDKKPITVTGEVTKLEWTNPHARVTVEAKDDKGQVVHWDFELGPPTALMRRGWNRNSLKPGTIVTVAGFLAKDEVYVANARTVTLADGRQVFVGSSFDTQTPAGARANGVTP